MQPFNIDRLCEVFVKARLQTSVHIFRHAISGKGHSRGLTNFPGRLDKFNARPIWQADVAQDNVKFLLFELLTRRRDRRACFDLVAHLAKDISHHLGSILVIFN